MREAAGELDVQVARRGSRSRRILAALALCLPALLASASIVGHPSYGLTAFGDLSELFLLATATIFFVSKGIRSGVAARAFWLLIGLGFAMWSVNMFLWAFYEVWLNRPVPSLPVGEFLLFVKLVPMLAALALEPDNENPDRPQLLGLFDLSSLLVYWTYLFLFWAMAYLLAGNDLVSYNRHADIVDAIGNQVFLVILAVVAFRSRGHWRSFYFNFLGAAATYSIASILINRAISLGRYYTGSLYDVPLAGAMAWFCATSIAFRVETASETPESSEPSKSKERQRRETVIWPGRLAMLATLSTPMIGLWLVTSGELHDPVRHFRVLLTLFATLLLTILLLLKQEVLNFQLAGFLMDAFLAYSNLKRFEDQLVQNEKLVSLGTLVARVAHEIHKAMAAVARDIAELNSHPADGNRGKMIAKIDESARRTNGLVESMLSFAQERPVDRSSLHVRPLLESAMNLARAERRQSLQMEIREPEAVPQIEGDASQLIQVFLHIIANAIDAMEGNQAGLLTVDIRTEGQNVEIGFADTGVGLKDPRRVFEPFYTTKAVGKGVGLGLSTCYGIIRQHGGEIECRNRPEGGAIFRLVLRAAVVPTVEVTA